MNTFTKTSKSIGISAMLLALLWMAAFNAIADPLANVFSGNVVLDGEISDFFDTNGLPLPGVCVTNDPAPPNPAVAGSEGLGESPSSVGSTRDTMLHPSGFNQRRIMSAYNPSLNGGTIFVGIDLPGGTNGIANPNYSDMLAPVRTGPDGFLAIRPFDADGNGEPDFIGRLADGLTPFSACPSPDGTLPDVWSCENESAGAIDNPRGRTLGEEEFYNVTLTFGGGQTFRVIFIEQNTTLPGQADVTTSPLVTLFGARVSSSTGGTGVPLGFDVEIAVTNVNAAIPNQCDRQNQRITVRSGSNSDGSGQGEDVNSLICLYNLPASIAVTKQCPPTNAAPGTLLVFTGIVTNTGQATLTNVTVVNNQPTNNTPVLGPISLAPGTSAKFTNNYLVPTNVCSVTDTMMARGHHCAYILAANIVVVTNIVVTNTATATCLISNTGLIRVTKTCPSTNAAPGSVLIFSGTVSNTGTITLTNVTVVNTQPTNNTPVFGPVTLVPGQSANFTGSYLVPANVNACAIPDTLSATGRDICFGSNVTHTAMATCLVSNMPRLRLTKMCPATNTVPGSLLVFSGTVTNTGTIAITNIMVVNNQPGPNTPVNPAVIAILQPGQGAAFTGSYPVLTNACSVSDTLTVINARDLCGTLVNATTNATCTVSNTPRLKLTKVCPATNAVPGSLLVFSGTVTNTGTIAITNIMVVNNQPGPNTPVNPAVIPILQPGQGAAFTGSYPVPTNVCSVSDTLTVINARDVCGTLVSATTNATCTVSNTPRLQLTKACPATNAVPGSLLVFSGTVTNTGNIAITNIMVVNNQPGPNTPVNPAVIAILQPGQGAAFTGSYPVPTNACSVSDTLTVINARDVCGTLVSATTNATCTVSNTPRLRLTKVCPATNAAPGTLLVFTGTVTNTGNIAITNIMVVNDKPVPNTPVNPPLIAILQPGQGASFSGSYIAEGCGTNFTDTVTASGRDSCGKFVSDSASATCSVPCPPSGGCRVTGGSNRQTNSFQAPCITTPLPTHISHGGQVGAPFSVGTPFTPNSPCISGEWQHNRHERNGNHLVGNFHASGNGHERQFDSLLCACLPCDENPNAVGVVGELCNPGDRICGPEPRRAPANKICFSGVGDYTFTNGRKTVKAVFRVDIEDRGEGNSHASSSPPDRYRIRLWILDPSCGRNPDPNSAEAMALRFAASADPTKIANLATTEELKVNIQPDIDDGGNMTQGNHQIHPATGAKCNAVIPLPAARIDVATEIACMTPGSVCPFGIIAQGYQGPQDPAFAYRITITNGGTVTLTNLSVAETTDTSIENTSSLYFAPGATLPPGGWVTRYFTNTWDTDTIYTVIVAGQSGQDGEPVLAASTAMASVSPAQTQPYLSMQRSGDSFILQWPAETAPGFVLETTTNLTPPVTWTVITNANNPFVIPDTPVDGTRFYRMRLP